MGGYYRRDRGAAARGIFGADPDAPVFRGPGKLPWQDHPSKIRCPRTGLLLPVVSDPRRVTTEEGERLRSTRYFRTQALEILARTDLKPRDRNRLLGMVRKACAVFLEARRAGIPLDGSSPAAKARERAKRRAQYQARKS